MLPIWQARELAMLRRKTNGIQPVNHSATEYAGDDRVKNPGTTPQWKAAHNRFVHQPPLLP
jgi:hypothetical protein